MGRVATAFQRNWYLYKGKTGLFTEEHYSNRTFICRDKGKSPVIIRQWTVFLYELGDIAGDIDPRPFCMQSTYRRRLHPWPAYPVNCAAAERFSIGINLYMPIPAQGTGDKEIKPGAQYFTARRQMPSGKLQQAYIFSPARSAPRCTMTKWQTSWETDCNKRYMGIICTRIELWYENGFAGSYYLFRHDYNRP